MHKLISHLLILALTGFTLYASAEVNMTDASSANTLPSVGKPNDNRPTDIRIIQQPTNGAVNNKSTGDSGTNDTSIVENPDPNQRTNEINNKPSDRTTASDGKKGSASENAADKASNSKPQDY